MSILVASDPDPEPDPQPWLLLFFSSVIRAYREGSQGKNEATVCAKKIARCVNWGAVLVNSVAK
jgi:hypothetical protein